MPLCLWQKKARKNSDKHDNGSWFGKRNRLILLNNYSKYMSDKVFHQSWVILFIHKFDFLFVLITWLVRIAYYDARCNWLRRKMLTCFQYARKKSLRLKLNKQDQLKNWKQNILQPSRTLQAIKDLISKKITSWCLLDQTQQWKR